MCELLYTFELKSIPANCVRNISLVNIAVGYVDSVIIWVTLITRVDSDTDKVVLFTYIFY